MSNPKPLQDGDSLQGVTSSGGTMWRPGQLAPASAIRTSAEASNDSEGDTVHEVDVDKYGDCYDSTAVARVRIAPWSLDTDHDGHLN